MKYFFLAVLLLTGCHSRGFVRENTTHNEFLLDNYHCKEESKQYSGGNWSRGYRNTCMEEKGYEISRADKAWRAPNEGTKFFKNLNKRSAYRNNNTIYLEHRGSATIYHR